MKANAIVGLMRSREAYIRDWLPLLEASVGKANNEPVFERVFDVSEVITRDPDAEVVWDWSEVGRELPFPMLAIVGEGEGVFIVVGGDVGFYVYCHLSPVPLVVATFTPTGVQWSGMKLDASGTPTITERDDPQTSELLSAAAMLLKIVTDACNDTRHIVSYTLNRGERRAAAKETDTAMLGTAVVHHVCLNMQTKHALEAQRGATVVPTPKRLHEVRSHNRHMKSGKVVRVRSHRRGAVGPLLPRVYTVRPNADGAA